MSPGTRAVIESAVVAGIAATCAVVLSGCHSDTPLPDSTFFVASYQQLLKDGTEAGMSPAQAAVIQNALDEGRLVTFEEYKQATDNEVSCIEDLGLTTSNRREIDHGGWTEIAFGYSISVDEEQQPLLDAADACLVKHAQFVGLAYQENQTIAQADALFAKYKGAIVACMATRGAQVDRDATRQQVLVADHEATPQGEQSCADSSGYSAAS